MTRPGDTLVLYILLVIALYFILRSWLPTKFSDWIKGPKREDKDRVTGKIPDFLRTQGYRVTTAKIKVPMTLEIDEEKTYNSRLYVDYLAEKDGERFVVIVEREKRPLKMTGSGLRDHFLALFLIYRPQGILYINKNQQILQVELDVPDYRIQKKGHHHWYYLFFFVCGMIIDSLSR